MNDDTYKQQSRSNTRQIEARETLSRLFRENPLPEDQLLINLGLFMRSSALARIFFLNEIYEKIVDLPGCVMEFGTWWGQSLILFENFRAIHEPYNFSRRVIGFDTFSGYAAVGENDIPSETIKPGGYATTTDYVKYLAELIDYHESENVMSHIKKHRLVSGDVNETAPKFFRDNPETIVALAFFDMALYEPTKNCLEAIKPHLIKGSVLAFDELNTPEYPGETLAVMETIGLSGHQLRRSRFTPDRCYMIIE
jgi:hypothetical protein